MNGIATVASLPTAGGFASALRAEICEAPALPDAPFALTPEQIDQIVNHIGEQIGEAMLSGLLGSDDFLWLGPHV